MKRSVFLWFTAFALAISFTSAGQMVSISGRVLSSDNGLPVPQHPVDIMVNDWMLVNTLFTDFNGYFSDTVPNMGMYIDSVIISTFDCVYEPHNQVFVNINEPIFAEFSICTDSLPGGCHAFFEAVPSPQDPFTFTFLDRSIGFHDSWLWDFGDGNTSSLPEPTYTYQDTGTYYVCLTIGDSLGFCSSTICFSLNVPAESCLADFSWDVMGGNPLVLSFNDLSMGDIQEWYWDFGDGSFSYMQEPMHNFGQPGNYTVCLTVIGGDSISPCFDMYCEDIYVGDTTLPCSADFEYALDSTTSEPNTFIFTSTVAGGMYFYLWDFGDGNTGEGMQVVHQYMDEGNYEVCLTLVDGSYPGCTDIACKTISTPDYTYFGGQVFAGDFPLNNPVSTGDTGVAYLYRVYDDLMIPLDTVYFDNEMGLYAFNMVLPADYIIKAGLTEGSENYKEYFPTYYPQVMHWQHAGILNLEGTIQNANIHLLPTLQDLPQGPGTISGNIVINSDRFQSLNPANIEVLLFNHSMEPLDFTFTDESGTFTFSNLPLDTYYLLAEEAGWNSSRTEVNLNQSFPAVNTALIELDEIYTFGTEELDKAETEVNLWPNPVTDILHFNLKGNVPTGDLQVMVTDLMGRIVVETSFHVSGDDHTFEISVNELPAGVYLLRISHPSSNFGTIKKFIR